MAIKVALDTNILLDLLLKDRPHKEESRRILSAAESHCFVAQISTQSIIDAAYTAKKQGLGYAAFVKAIGDLRRFLGISSIDWIDLSWAASNPTFPSSGDIEDDVQFANAYNTNCDYFITRDQKLLCFNMEDSPITVISPDDFVQAMK